MGAPHLAASVVTRAVKKEKAGRGEEQATGSGAGAGVRRDSRSRSPLLEKEEGERKGHLHTNKRMQAPFIVPDGRRTGPGPASGEGLGGGSWRWRWVLCTASAVCV